MLEVLGAILVVAVIVGWLLCEWAQDDELARRSS
jgi:hypothetical protein